MTNSDSARSLLLGILALEHQLIEPSELYDAARRVMIDPDWDLEASLASSGSLDADQQQRLRSELDHFRPSVVATEPFRPSTGASAGDSAAARGAGSSGGDRYRVLRLHAEGGLGRVSLATDRELDREVALKEVRPDRVDRTTSRERFLFEARITGSLQHPGIVPVYGLGTNKDGHPCYAMRFVHGESLHAAIRRFHEQRRQARGAAPLELRRMLGQLIDVCQAIQYAHSRGILHRDIKPANIMLGDYGETLVVDWGLAKPLRMGAAGAPADGGPEIAPPAGEMETRPGAIVGTLSFMSPEQARGTDDVGPATDIFGLGATLYAILTGEPPYPERDEEVLLDRARRGDVRSPRAVNPVLPRPLAAICAKAMAAAPAERYADAKGLADDLERWLADERVSAYPDPLAVRVGRWVRKHRTLVGSAVAAMLVFLVSLGASVVLLAGANRELETALANEAAAKGQAQTRFDIARNAIRSYHTGISRDALLAHAELKELKSSLLGTALQFYHELRDHLELSPGPETDLPMADAYAEIGAITRQIGSMTDAIDALEREAAIRGRLVAGQPDSVPRRAALADCYFNLGLLERAISRNSDAQRTFRQALEIRRRLYEENPADESHRTHLVMCLDNLGLLHADAGELDEAERLSRQSSALFADLADRNPGEDLLQIRAAQALNSLSALQDRMGRAADARSTLDTAARYCQAAIDLDSNKTYYLMVLGGIQLNLGRLESAAGRRADAIASNRRGVELLEQVVAANPSMSQPRSVLATAVVGLGGLVDVPATRDEAARYYRRGLELLKPMIDENPASWEIRITASQASHNLAHIEQIRGDTDIAEHYYRAAVLAVEPLTAGVPAVAEQLADCRDALGSFLAGRGEAAEAVRLHRQAIDLWHERLAGAPQSAALRAKLADSLQRLGQAQLALGEAPLAIEALSKSTGFRQSLLDADPESIELMLALTNDVLYLVQAQRAAGLDDAVLAGDRRVVELLRCIVTLTADVEQRQRLGGSLSNLARQLNIMKQLDEALDAADESVAIMTEIARVKAQDTQLARDLAACLDNRARVHQARSERADAERDFGAAIAIMNPIAGAGAGPENARDRSMLAYCYLNLGMLKRESGDFDAARAAWQTALDGVGAGEELRAVAELLREQLRQLPE